MSNHKHCCHQHQTIDDQNFAKKIDFLDGAMRKETFSPEDSLNLLSIHQTSRILDVGAGSGYLTIPAAKRTGETVYALDMDARMLGVIDTKAKAETLHNIQLMQGDINGIPLKDQSVDVVLASLILHEVDPLSPVLRELRRVLKTGGYLLCMEYEKEESTVKGPPMHIRISSAEMETELISAGFQIAQKVFPQESIYIITAHK